MKKDNIEEVSQSGPDEALVLAVRRGDTGATEQLLKRYIPLVGSRAAVFAASGFEYDDMFQEGMIGLYGAIGSFDETVGAPFSSFARLCVDRMMIAVLRSSGRKMRIPGSKISSFHEAIYNESEQGIDPESIVIAKEDFARFMDKARNQLSPFEHDVLNAFISGYSYSDISDKLGVTVHSVDNALQRIRRKLKK